MSDIILWSLLAFFGAFGVIEFIRFVYTDWQGGYNHYHVVVSTRNNEDNIEAVIRNTILSIDCASVIVLDDNASKETKNILKKLKEKYSYIRIVTPDEYADFLQGKEC